jgi:6-phosphogluconolactonase
MNMTLTVLPDAEALSGRVAAAIARVLADAVSARGRASIALAGGQTPRAVYTALARRPVGDVPWADVDVFWGDERYVRTDDPRSNYRMARETLLDAIDVAPRSVHPMPTDRPQPADAAAAYERTLREYFHPGPPQFDLLLLGLGQDGHTASLFPGSPALASTRWVEAVDAPFEPAGRITLTPLVIGQARVCFAIATGSDKAGALASALASGADLHRVPAAIVTQARGAVTWWVDTAAAARLTPGTTSR